MPSSGTIHISRYPNITASSPNDAAWLRNAQSQLPAMPPSQALDTILRYDYIYRITYHRPPSTALIDRYILQAFEAHIQGDTTIDQYTLYRAIDTPVRQARNGYLDRPLQWWSTSLDRWYRQATGTRKPPPDESLYDQLSQAAILLQADLWAYRPTDQQQFKQHLAARYHPHLTTPTSDPKLQQAIRQLKAAAHPYL